MMDKRYDQHGNCVAVVFPQAAGEYAPDEPHGHCQTCGQCLDHRPIPLDTLIAWLRGAKPPIVVCTRCDKLAERIANEVEQAIDTLHEVAQRVQRRAAKARNN